MVHAAFKITCLICVMFTMAFPDEPQLIKADNLYNSSDLNELERVLPALSKSFPDHPSVLFYQALFENDAGKALSLYNTIHSKHPRSKYADDALFRVGQFYHTTGQLDRADSIYNKLLSDYPQSELLDRAAYAQCQVLFARGEFDAAETHLRHFLQFFPRSEFTDVVVWDLENLQQDIDQATLREIIEQENVFSIQIGVLRQLKNAKRVQKELSEKFNDVNIREQLLGNEKLYAITLGTFYERKKAEQFAKRFIAPHLDDYKIIKKNIFSQNGTGKH